MRLLLLASTVGLSACWVTPDELSKQVAEQQDNDGDGHASSTYEGGQDCDDTNPDINPDAEEVCDGADNNCDGEIDEDSATDAPTWYADTDGDGYGDAGNSIPSCDAPTGHVEDNTDCDDSTADIAPNVLEVCNEVDDNCDGDIDEDAASDAVNWYADTDGDTYGDNDSLTVACEVPAGHVEDNTDCDDSTADIAPGLDETCNDIDDNCDGAVDEDSATNAATWYADSDGDTFGDAANSVPSCDAPSGYVADATDCDDSNANIAPSHDETCNGADDNCDGAIDEDSATDAPTWYADSDGDTFGDADNSVPSCDAPSGYVADATDCDDLDPNSHPGADELCSTPGVDDDCDGSIDESDATDVTNWYQDSDGDGHGNSLVFSTRCSPPSGFVSAPDDCDDLDSQVNPSATEVCDGVDNDCDGSTDGSDAADAQTVYTDSDGDGYGETASGINTCNPSSNQVTLSGDCDDGRPDYNPDAIEVLNDGTDWNCDGDTNNPTWIEISDISPTGVKGIQLTGDDNEHFLAVSADTLTDSTGLHSNALAVRTIDALDPLNSSASQVIYESNFTQVSLEEAFDFAADSSYLYWGQANTLSGFGDGTSSIALHTIHRSTGAVNGNNEPHPGATSWEPATDVHLYSYDSNGQEYLQTASCSSAFGTMLLFGRRPDFVNNYNSVDVITQDDVGQTLDAGDRCIFSHYYGPTSGSLLYSAFISNVSTPGTGVSTNSTYYYGYAGSDLFLYMYYAYSMMDWQADVANGRRFGVISSNYSTPELRLWEGADTTDWEISEYLSTPEPIVQLDAGASSTGEMLTCGIGHSGQPYLFFAQPDILSTGTLTTSIDPTGSGSSWDECAISVSANGMGMVALRAGADIYLGAIELP